MVPNSIAAWGKGKYLLYFSIPTTVLLIGYLFTLKHSSGSDFVTVLGLGYVPTRAGTSHYTNVITIIGSSLALLGIFMTYWQLKESFDRIETYDQLFRAIDQIITEIQSGRAQEFYFSGSTLLPGAIASADRKRADRLEEKLQLLFGKGVGTHAVPEDVKIRILLPSPGNVAKIFDFYSGKCVQGRKNDITPEIIAKELQRAEALVSTAQEDNPKRTNCKVTRLTDDDANTTLLEGEYFFSNGRRTVHVLLLHYQPVPGSKVVTPALLGTNTRDATILNSLRQRFYALDRENLFGENHHDA